MIRDRFRTLKTRWADPVSRRERIELHKSRWKHRIQRARILRSLVGPMSRFIWHGRTTYAFYGAYDQHHDHTEELPETWVASASHPGETPWVELPLVQVDYEPDPRKWS